ncbi:hypothetical protein P4234_01340 [Pseudomonas aeruginosa]|nr:hypothetical protein [Pseudomonas aeruginosa]
MRKGIAALTSLQGASETVDVQTDSTCIAVCSSRALLPGEPQKED